MPFELSVIVRTDGRRIRDVVRSLDTQSLAADRFEVVVVGATEDPESADRLAGRRSNLRLGSAVDPLVGGPDVPNPRYVLELGANQRLLPGGLERLIGYAEAHQLDAVAGRQVELSRPLSSLFADDRSELVGDEAHEALASPVVLRRRNRLSVEHGRLQFDAEGARVGIQTQHPVAIDAEGEAVPALPITVERPRLQWRGRDLAVDVSGTVTAEEQEQLEPILLVRHLGTSASYILATEGSVGASTGIGGGNHRGWTASTVFSPLNAAAGGRLIPGEWQLDVIVTGSRVGSLPTRLPGSPLPVALLDDVVAVPHQRRGTLCLDVGPVGQPLIGSAAAEDSGVVESAAGSVMRIALPSWHVATRGSIRGFIALRGLRLPAVIETESGTAVLTAFVTGLAGSYPISASFGLPPLQPFGLTLEVAGTGLMWVAAMKPERPAGSTDSDAERKARRRRAKRRKRRAAHAAEAKRQPQGPLAKVRAAMPSAWEPQIRRLARIPLLRSSYRRLTRGRSAETK